jgi:hypothetical protein
VRLCLRGLRVCLRRRWTLTFTTILPTLQVSYEPI